MCTLLIKCMRQCPSGTLLDPKKFCDCITEDEYKKLYECISDFYFDFGALEQTYCRTGDKDGAFMDIEITSDPRADDKHKILVELQGLASDQIFNGYVSRQCS